MELFISTVIFILGLCCGSFVNMLVYRTARKYDLVKSRKSESLKENRSFCDFCGKQLHWYENVPVISWLVQKGKTRCCSNPLPREYPIVELGTGILFLINQQNWLGMVVITLLVFATVFDWKYMILPDFSSYILIGLGLVSLIWRSDRLGAILSGAGMFLFIWILSKMKVKGKQAMGDGDAAIAGFMGLWLGWPKIIVAFYTAFIIGAIVGGGMIFLRKKKGDDHIPFGPFLILGTLVAWWWGETIIKFLMSNF